MDDKPRKNTGEKYDYVVLQRRNIQRKTEGLFLEKNIKNMTGGSCIEIKQGC